MPLNQRPLALLTITLASLLTGAALNAQDPPAAKAPPPKESATQVATPQASSRRTNDPIERIRDEGLNRSQVMKTLLHLTDLNGPRLTGSPGLKRANEWTRDQLSSWGLTNSHLEAWGPFGRGWSLQRFSAQLIEPQAMTLIAMPKAWSPSLPRPIETEVIHVDIKRPEDFAKYRGKLEGKIVLDGSVRELKAQFDAPGARRSETNLLALANAGDAFSIPFRPPPSPGEFGAEQRAAFALTPRKYQFFAEEGVALLLHNSPKGDGGTVFLSGATVYSGRSTNEPAAVAVPPTAVTSFLSGIRSFSPWSTNCPPIIPQLTLTSEHFNRLARLLAHGEKLRMAVELQSSYHNDDLMAYNTVAEIPGTDKADEIVMLGAHLDSWHGGTGTTDNAAGVSVAMEAVRILKAAGLQPRRTIRVALWTGEEQGLHGSRAYVARHFGSLTTTTITNAPAAPAKEGEKAAPPITRSVTRLEAKPDYQKLSAYYNLDNGTGKIRGIYLQGNEAARPIFRQWLAPFRDLGAETVTYSFTGSTDHVPFDSLGLPGFQFIQDTIEYSTRTHHSNMDFFDRAQADDLKQASVIMAAFVYQTAMRDEKIPRKTQPGSAPTSPTTTEPGGSKKGRRTPSSQE